MNLKVHKTGYRGVKVDGESQLPILGENHVQPDHVLRPVNVHSTSKELLLNNKLSKKESKPYYNFSSLVDSRLGWETHNDYLVEKM